ncbi:hypothetical protein [Aeromicrobium duanguangcaii]|uniref:DUF2238 domain-containing protein n=1 Tax=Aeromicrobium duanguangcaii TaxID=2968086 RepID=A0ABY5KEC7_9ACTN|nr:hypothetical protein [Aeromicrobium duanguangcaii]MCD9154103.1 hypothetical protein [Aeromicrobium duanguangcaii]MCL3837839.1 hypothetical protein [Aeromicrobium duanguangcaii]UUI68824.1 hypothetical protein NP095_01565 [Aeromicrobium duanguangcaii]
MPQPIVPSVSDLAEQQPRLHWAALLFTVVTMLSAVVVGITASDHFTRVTMAAAVMGCVLLWQALRDPLVMTGLTTVILGAVAGWGLNFYDRIWWYDDFAHFTFSLVSTLAIARLLLHRFRAEPAFLLPIVLWLTWLGIGSLWEIGEWTSDQLQSTHHSRGYADTMADMILNSSGSGIAAWVYWRWLRTPADLQRQS